MSIVSPQMILLAYWLVIVVIGAFCLRMACSLCQADIPGWRRAFISVVVVTSLAYLTFDFTEYLIMRSMQDVVIQVPPWYGYNFWFRESMGFKWMVVSHAGPLRYLGPIFALCVAGMLQVIVLQADVTFRWGLLIFLLQLAATAVAGYVVALVLGAALDAAGWTPQPVTVAQAPGQSPGQTGHKDKGASAGEKIAQSREKTSQKTPKAAPGFAHKGPGGAQSHSGPTSLQAPEHDPAGEKQPATFQDVAQNLKNYANSHLDEVKEELAPVTGYLPEPVRDFLDAGGWWLVFGIVGFLALLWLRSIVRKLRGVTPRKKRKRRWPKTKEIAINLKEKLALIGEAMTEEGPMRITVKGVPARLRLIILSLGTRNAGELSEEMADRVLDWIKPGLAHASAPDYPAVRVWPPFFSSGGFATAVAANIRFPELQGEQSPWVVLVGQVKMGKAIINLALGFYADEPNTLRILKVGNQWLGVLGVQKPVTAR